ncbi:MAG TPA: 2-oxo-4-hydroxy-4-carboxy-5-ureidoimidazoline decarboxylase [Pyrinomonadaceae bacterium]|jgi:OHCU decarboxylase|nr:2-oxo-4-hydroxy-4-carboxy-5-ureidoimidazoline decarboxylase [Pyrinomonadaceae bacterium]
MNALSTEEAEAELLKCCGSTLWARRMAEVRPFQELQGLLANADSIWWALEKEDWLEAFSRHPKIGEKESERAQARAARNWSEQEQSGTHSADEETRRALADANREYAQKFGYIYIICATGKTADEMLFILKERLHNDADKEIRVAAEEQLKITHLRLQKLLEGQNPEARSQKPEGNKN